MIIKVRKKPIIIEAIQFTGYNHNEVCNFAVTFADKIYYDEIENIGVICIHTLEGDMIVDEDDYIIKGINGEFYPCKPDIFMKTYDIIED